MTAPFLELRGVTKAFPDFTLGPLSATFRPGCVHGILGPNGAGKTTLLNLVTLQSRATSGEMRYRGASVVWGDAGWKGRLAYVREAPSFYDELTVEQTLRLASRLYDSWDVGLAAHLSMRLGLRGRQQVRTLSKGTRVKLGLVAALASRADLLVLDEPTAGVDPTSRDELHDVLRHLRRERPDLCVLLSSHIFEDLEASADEVLILRDGQIAFQASREEMRGFDDRGMLASIYRATARAGGMK